MGVASFQKKSLYSIIWTIAYWWFLRHSSVESVLSASINMTGKSFSVRSVSASALSKGGMIITAWCLEPKRWNSLEQNSESQRRQRSEWPFVFENSKTHFNESWSIWITKRVPSRFVHNINRDLTIVRHSRHVMLNGCQDMVKDHYRNLSDLIVTSDWSCSRTNRTSTLQAVLCETYWPPAYDKSSTCCGTSISYSWCILYSSSAKQAIKCIDWNFFSFCFYEAFY